MNPKKSVETKTLIHLNHTQEIYFGTGLNINGVIKISIHESLLKSALFSNEYTCLNLQIFSQKLVSYLKIVSPTCSNGQNGFQKFLLVLQLGYSCHIWDRCKSNYWETWIPRQCSKPGAINKNALCLIWLAPTGANYATMRSAFGNQIFAFSFSPTPCIMMVTLDCYCRRSIRNYQV